MEIGPWRVNDHGGLDVAEGGWEEYTNIVYGASLPSSLSLSLYAETLHPDIPAR